MTQEFIAVTIRAFILFVAIVAEIAGVELPIDNPAPEYDLVGPALARRASFQPIPMH